MSGEGGGGGWGWGGRGAEGGRGRGGSGGGGGGGKGRWGSNPEAALDCRDEYEFVICFLCQMHSLGTKCTTHLSCLLFICFTFISIGFFFFHFLLFGDWLLLQLQMIFQQKQHLCETLFFFGVYQLAACMLYRVFDGSNVRHI